MLIAGDPERALKLGDSRWVRIVVVIEAMTVEPDGAHVRRRVHRMGLVANRPSLMAAAVGWCTRLRAEHARLMGTPEFQPVAKMCASTQDGALGMPIDEKRLAVLRQTLVRHQLGRWASTLQGLGLKEERLEESQIGAWLADVASASGILDVAGLRAMLLRPRSDGGMSVEPDLPERVAKSPASVERSTNPMLIDPVFESPPVFSREVDCDNLERWVGWMRFVRGVERVPGQRGRDLDVYVGNDEVLAGVAEAFHDVVGRSQGMPGDLLVVVAGDGFRPEETYSPQASALMQAHQRLVAASGVHYLRVQHAPSVHMAWMKGVLLDAKQRAEGAGSVQIYWEEQHGRSVNVILVARRTHCGLSPEESGYVRPVSLDGWTIERCFVMLATENGIANRGGQVAVATDKRSGPVNAELLHFARSHCQGLLNQVTASSGEAMGSVERTQRVLERWIQRGRKGWSALEQPMNEAARMEWMRDHLGVDDRWLLEALSAELETARPACDIAQELWAGLRPWRAPHVEA
jgi:hypothetical protein